MNEEGPPAIGDVLEVEILPSVKPEEHVQALTQAIDLGWPGFVWMEREDLRSALLDGTVVYRMECLGRQEAWLWAQTQVPFYRDVSGMQSCLN